MSTEQTTEQPTETKRVFTPKCGFPCFACVSKIIKIIICIIIIYFMYKIIKRLMKKNEISIKP